MFGPWFLSAESELNNSQRWPPSSQQRSRNSPKRPVIRSFSNRFTSGDVGSDSGRAKAKATVKGRWTKLSFAKGWMAGEPRFTRKVGWWKKPLWSPGCEEDVSDEIFGESQRNWMASSLDLDWIKVYITIFINLLIFKRGKCQNDAQNKKFVYNCWVPFTGCIFRL